VAADDWTPQVGIVRGVCTGSVAAATIGVVLVAGTWWLGPSGSSFSDFFWARLGMALLGFGFVFAWVVAAICGWAGGLNSIVFLILAGAWTALLAVALTITSLHLTDWAAGNVPRWLTASLWIGVPTAIGGYAACAIRWRMRSWQQW